MFRTEGGRTIKLFLFFLVLPSLCARTSRLFSPFFVDLSSQFHTESNEPSIFGQFGHSVQLQQTALYWIGRTSHVAVKRRWLERRERRSGAAAPRGYEKACQGIHHRPRLNARPQRARWWAAALKKPHCLRSFLEFDDWLVVI